MQLAAAEEKWTCVPIITRSMTPEIKQLILRNETILMLTGIDTKHD